MPRLPQRDAQTLEKNAICLVSPNGEVTVIQPDKSLPNQKRETINPLS
ncbi:hypothetical protein [Stenomitos frigidus]|nr:hypothetical protein [Stenomitos frigidus]